MSWLSTWDGTSSLAAEDLSASSGYAVSNFDPLYRQLEYGSPAGFDSFTYDLSLYIRTATAPALIDVTARTYVPATPAVAAEPKAYETYAVIEKLANHGWNTYARSIAPIAAGSYVLFQAAGDITGACLTVGVKGKEGQDIHLFDHSLIIDIEGIRAYEKGNYVSRMRLSHDPVTALRIYRHVNNTIVYAATTGAETVVYSSVVQPSLPSFLDMYVYGFLYASGDRVTSASFETGEVQYGRV